MVRSCRAHLVGYLVSFDCHNEKGNKTKTSKYSKKKVTQMTMRLIDYGRKGVLIHRRLRLRHHPLREKAITDAAREGMMIMAMTQNIMRKWGNIAAPLKQGGVTRWGFFRWGVASLDGHRTRSWDPKDRRQHGMNSGVKFPWLSFFVVGNPERGVPCRGGGPWHHH